MATVTSGGRFPTNYATSTVGTVQLDTSGVAEGFVVTRSVTEEIQLGGVTFLVDQIGRPDTDQSNLPVEREMIEQRDSDSGDLIIRLRRTFERRLFRVRRKIRITQLQRDAASAKLIRAQAPSDFVGQAVNRTN